MNGHLTALKLLRDRGCPWNRKKLLYAKENGHDGVYSWALSNGCPTDEDDFEGDVFGYFDKENRWFFGMDESSDGVTQIKETTRMILIKKMISLVY
jgi:hypothetical protein